MSRDEVYFIVIVLVLSACHQEAGGYVDSRWAQQGSFDRNSSIKKTSVPTLSHDYLPNKNRNHPWKMRHDSFYARQPVAEVALTSRGGSEVQDSERSKIPTTGVFKTYGRGQVMVPYKGATFHVPRTSGSKKAHRAAISTRIFPYVPDPTQEPSGVISRSRRDCASCPKDEIVVASRGNPFVLLPQPCAHRWNTLSGPKPGNKLGEGIHYISGTLGHRKQVCIFKFEVKVLRCPAFNDDDDVEVSCTADNAWGSTCNFTCPPRKKLIGVGTTECSNDLRWTAPKPVSLDMFDCLVPNIENGTTLNCQTNEVIDSSNDNYLPQGSLCKIKNNSTDVAIRCKKGDWVAVHHGKGKKHHKKVKGLKTKSRHYKRACDLHPCHNGGTCLLSAVNTPAYICLCKPSTEGPRCEYSKCETNACDNGGHCLRLLSNETVCFCEPNYTGDLCQLRIPSP